ncbi:MAG: hypothetical protein H8D67_22920 [Deltaproteobacteria bacterium]|nr:hypothetical protein [Deltaproteobacteria bacterium]
MLMLTPQELHVQSSTPKVNAGRLAEDEFGRIWIYLQASEALSFGSVIKPLWAVLNQDVDAAAAADKRRVTATGDFTTTNLKDIASRDLPHGHIYHLFINAGAAQGQGGIITQRIDNDNVDVYWETSDDGKIATALTTSSDYIVSCLSRIAKITEATDLTIAVAQMAITDEYWFWGLYIGKGYVLLDQSDGVPDATGRGIIPAATDSGKCAGHSGTPSTDELLSTFGRALGNAEQDADMIIPALINCSWTVPVGYSGVPANVNTDWPKK